jgi:hypothetical protein
MKRLWHRMLGTFSRIAWHEGEKMEKLFVASFVLVLISSGAFTWSLASQVPDDKLCQQRTDRQPVRD